MNKIIETIKEPNRNSEAEEYNNGREKFTRRDQHQTGSSRRKNWQT